MFTEVHSRRDMTSRVPGPLGASFACRMSALPLTIRQGLCYRVSMVQAVQVDMFPSRPRNTVLAEVRDSYNQFKADQERLGGLMPVGIARVCLGLTRQRLHQLLENGTLRFVTHDGHRYVSGDDIKQRLKDKRDGLAGPGRRWK